MIRAARQIAFAVVVLIVAGACADPIDACPFCGVVGDSLAMRRDSATTCAVGEHVSPAEPGPEGFPVQMFRLDQTLRGKPAADRQVSARVDGPVTGTALLFGTGTPEALRWAAIAANEALLAHVATAPATTLDAAERLRWFAARLEHPEPAIAGDAFIEFGLAPFEAVRSAADALDPAALAAWVSEPGIDERRRGFYGLATGIVASRTADPATRARLVAALDAAIQRPGDDFRAGFDGILGGLLVARGSAGIDHLAQSGLFGPDARPVDQRHVLSALRFAAESLGATIPREDIAAAIARLLDQPAVAADAIVDLARLRDWTSVDRVADLWTTLGTDDPLLRRAVAGYLDACPLPVARARLDLIRAADPERLDAALEAARSPLAR